MMHEQSNYICKTCRTNSPNKSDNNVTRHLRKVFFEYCVIKSTKPIGAYAYNNCRICRNTIGSGGFVATIARK